MNRFLTLPHMPYFDIDLPAIIANKYGKESRLLPQPNIRNIRRRRTPRTKTPRKQRCSMGSWGGTASNNRCSSKPHHKHIRTTKEKRTIIHLLNYQPLQQILPVYNIRMKVLVRTIPIRRRITTYSMSDKGTLHIQAARRRVLNDLLDGT